MPVQPTGVPASAAGTKKPKRFLSVGEVALLFGMSAMTLYRAINGGEFPAVKIRGRFVIPAKAIDEMEAAAVDGQTLVNAADWAVPVRSVA